jgi:hypothetical protein
LKGPGLAGRRGRRYRSRQAQVAEPSSGDERSVRPAGLTRQPHLVAVLLRPSSVAVVLEARRCPDTPCRAPTASRYRVGSWTPRHTSQTYVRADVVPGRVTAQAAALLAAHRRILGSVFPVQPMSPASTDLEARPLGVLGAEPADRGRGGGLVLDPPSCTGVRRATSLIVAITSTLTPPPCLGWGGQEATLRRRFSGKRRGED